MSVREQDQIDLAAGRGKDRGDVGGVVRARIEHHQSLAALDQVGVGAVIGHRPGVFGDDAADAGQHRQRRAPLGFGLGQEGHAHLVRMAQYRGEPPGVANSVALGLQPLTRGGEGGAVLGVHHGKREIEALHRLDQRGDDHEMGEPFVVGGHHEPRRVRRRGLLIAAS